VAGIRDMTVVMQAEPSQKTGRFPPAWRCK